ncbi:MAG: hypothetical protein N3A72_10780 [bacterium]|nr:hypothetical protein [bacterium]
MSLDYQKLYQKILTLDRRWIFLLILVIALIFYKVTIPMPIKVTPQTQSFYDSIEQLKAGDVVHITADYTVSVVPELYPMHKAVVRRLLEKDVKIIVSTLWIEGVPLIDKAFDEVCAELEKEGKIKVYGVDYVNLGYKSGSDVVMTRLGTSFAETYPVDVKSTPVEKIPLMRQVKNFDDIALMVNFSVGHPGIREWLQQVQRRYNVKMLCGATGIMSPDLYSFYQSGQLKGLLAGLIGAAEYETLLNRHGMAHAGLTVQSAIHLCIILLILIGNIAFFLQKATRRKK